MRIKTQLFLPVTDWTEKTASRGRGVGNVHLERFVICVEPLNWIIATERKDKEGVFLPGSYFGSIKSILPCLAYMVADPEPVIQKIIGKLVELTGKTPALDMDDPFADLEKLGKWIDENFETSFMKTYPPQVFQNLFQQDLKEEELCS